MPTPFDIGQVAVSSSNRATSTIGGGIHYSMFRLDNLAISSLYRINLNTNLEIPNLVLSTDIQYPRSIEYVNNYLYIGTYMNGVYKINASTGNTVRILTSAQVTQDPYLGSVVVGDTVYWLSYGVSTQYSKFVELNTITDSFSIRDVIKGRYFTLDYYNGKFIGFSGDQNKGVMITPGVSSDISNGRYILNTCILNSSLYAPSSNKTNELIEINLNTMTPSFHPVSGITLGSGAIFTRDGRIYIASNNSSNLVEFDPVTKYSTVYSLPARGAWQKAIKGSNGRHYISASSGSVVLTTDPGLDSDRYVWYDNSWRGRLASTWSEGSWNSID